jgi:hypothetical protein
MADVMELKEHKNSKMLLMDFNLFEAAGKHTKNLQLLYDALQTVKPKPS